MNYVIEWFDGENQLEYPEYVLAEFATLCCKLNIPCVVNPKIFSEKVYQAICHIHYPELFTQPSYNNIEDSLLLETEWVKYKIGMTGNLEFYSTYNTSNLLVGMHQVYFHTDFGNIPRTNSSFESLLVETSRNNPWSFKSDASSAISYADLIASCGLCLKYLGSDLDPEEVTLMNQILDSAELNQYTYHAHLVRELYRTA